MTQNIFDDKSTLFMWRLGAVRQQINIYVIVDLCRCMASLGHNYLVQPLYVQDLNRFCDILIALVGETVIETFSKN